MRLSNRRKQGINTHNDLDESQVPSRSERSWTRRLHAVGSHVSDIREEARPEGEDTHQWLPRLRAAGPGEVFTRDIVTEPSGVVDLWG